MRCETGLEGAKASRPLARARRHDSINGKRRDRTITPASASPPPPPPEIDAPGAHRPSRRGAIIAPKEQGRNCVVCRRNGGR